jgi:hypothetical protein
MPAEGPPDGSSPRGRSARAAARVVGLFDSVGKVIGAVAGGLALAGALGVLTLSGDKPSPPTTARTETSPSITAHTEASRSSPREQQVEKSEIVASATVPSLPRQDDAQGANDYTADNVVDGDIHTAWVEGVPGLGGGARLALRLPHRVALDRIRIVSGYAKSNQVFLDNAAPKTVLIHTDGTEGPLRRTLSRDSRPQSIRAAFGRTRRVTIEIVSAYRGDRFEDLAISEIWFFARMS